MKMKGRAPNPFMYFSEVHTITYNEACYTGGEGTWGTYFSAVGKRLDNLVWKHSVEFYYHSSYSNFHTLAFPPRLL